MRIQINQKCRFFYDKNTQFTKKIISRNGKVTKYSYGHDRKNPELHYWTEVSRKSQSGKWIKNKYEYELKKRKDGSVYTHRILTVVNGAQTETTYSECCSLPVKIKKGKHHASFKYNKSGLLTRKISSRDGRVELEYNNKYKKVSKVVKGENWTKFWYNSNKKLRRAENNKGQKVNLSYDIKNQMKKVILLNKKSKKKQTLLFTPNPDGKPGRITMIGVGSINIAYDDYGQMKK